MKNVILVLLTLLSARAFAARFDCESVVDTLKEPEGIIRAHGLVDDNDQLVNVDIALLDKKDGREHSLLKVDGPLAALAKFVPKSQKLKGYEKFLLSKSRADGFYFYKPAKVTSGFSTVFVKFSFQGTFPDLEQLDCQTSP